MRAGNLLSCAAMIELIIAATDRTTNAGAKLPVCSFRRPINSGPMKPPTLTIVATTASPPAAASPLRNRVGMDQNGP